MIARLLRRLLRVRFVYATALEQRRASALLAVTPLFIVVLALALLVTSFSVQILLELAFPTALILTVAIAALVWVRRLVQIGRVERASRVFVGVMLLITAVPVLLQTAPLMALVVPLAAALVLLRWQEAALAGLAIGVVVFVRFSEQVNQPLNEILRPAETAQADVQMVALLLVTTAGVILSMAGASERAARQISSERVRLRAFSRGVSRLAEAPDEDALLRAALTLAQGDMQHTLAQVFLLDAQGRPVRRVFAIAPDEPLQSREAVSPGDSAVLNAVIEAGEPVEISAEDDAPLGIHVLVPATIALALPVRAGGVLLAVLSVQTDRDSFGPDDRAALAGLADVLAVGLVRVRMAEDQARAAREQEMMLTRLRDQVGAARGRSVATRAGTLALPAGHALGYDRSASGFTPAADLPPALRAALQAGDVLIDATPEMQQLTAPILLRGQVLGAMSFALPPQPAVTERQLDLVRTVAARLGIAVENARLYQQSQALAARERKSNEVASQLLTANEVDALMAQAAELFNDALGGVYARVLIRPDVLQDGTAESIVEKD
jgi:GAF domain-containing protein